MVYVAYIWIVFLSLTRVSRCVLTFGEVQSPLSQEYRTLSGEYSGTLPRGAYTIPTNRARAFGI